MKCWKLSQTKKYIQSGNDGDDELKFHIEICPECQTLVREAEEEEKLWMDLLYSESLPEGFTERVMSALEGVEIEQTEPIHSAAASKRIRKTRRLLKKSALWIASLFIVTAAFTLYAQPSIADWVRSIFSNETTDSGMMDARQVGLLQNPHVKVEDKGYVLEINEVIADATRLVMGVKVTDPERKPLVYQVNWNNLHIRDANGKEVAELRGIEGTDTIEKLTFTFTQEINTDELDVEGHVDRIAIPFSEQYVEGKWDFSFKLDMRKANELTVVTPLHQQYTTPEGMHIEMEKLVRTPSGVRLELNTSLRGKAAELSPEELEGQQQLMFHFENEQGEVISNVDSYKVGHARTIISQISEMNAGKLHWTYTFNYLPYDHQKLRFVFDGYSIPVKSGGSVELVSKDFKKSPIIFKDQGDEFTLNDFRVHQDPNLKEDEEPRESIIQVTGKMYNRFNNDTWVVKDQDGKEYQVGFKGSVRWGEVNLVSGEPGFIVYGMGKLPEKATLIRTVTDKFYDNVKWSFEIPKAKSIPGLENADPQN
ncbi:DUF4179 domain-containing protein [Paenibacillus donghaensis]|uniref:DUF4179 domain-containing protein n=1 Tax=Paenibacillus donghaensis TaxID=414771 RepID=UPI0018837947|nr:DUF4179 domain-containing protein [Paenibacillus donghaensis]MBE9915811.1 DUF4179 domain-containing protein [Paenibacillus donghaensis]